VKKSLLCALLLAPVGCRQGQPSQSADPIRAKLTTNIQAPLGRFQSVGPTNKVALDTKTGLLCKTWDWDDSHVESEFPMCVNLLWNEEHEVSKIRGLVDVGDQLKSQHVNPHAYK